MGELSEQSLSCRVSRAALATDWVQSVEDRPGLHPEHLERRAEQEGVRHAAETYRGNEEAVVRMTGLRTSAPTAKVPRSVLAQNDTRPAAQGELTRPERAQTARGPRIRSPVSTGDRSSQRRECGAT